MCNSCSTFVVSVIGKKDATSLDAYSESQSTKHSFDFSKFVPKLFVLNSSIEKFYSNNLL